MEAPEYDDGTSDMWACGSLFIGAISAADHFSRAWHADRTSVEARGLFTADWNGVVRRGEAVFLADPVSVDGFAAPWRICPAGSRVGQGARALADDCGFLEEYQHEPLGERHCAGSRDGETQWADRPGFRYRRNAGRAVHLGVRVRCGEWGGGAGDGLGLQAAPQASASATARAAGLGGVARLKTTVTAFKDGDWRWVYYGNSTTGSVKSSADSVDVR
ncbi:hypothetical protein GCM10023083_50540 [Streptomyces phyllanthi]